MKKKAVIIAASVAGALTLGVLGYQIAERVYYENYAYPIYRDEARNDEYLKLLDHCHLGERFYLSCDSKPDEYDPTWCTTEARGDFSEFSYRTPYDESPYDYRDGCLYRRDDHRLIGAYDVEEAKNSFVTVSFDADLPHEMKAFNRGKHGFFVDPEDVSFHIEYHYEGTPFVVKDLIHDGSFAPKDPTFAFDIGYDDGEYMLDSRIRSGHLNIDILFEENGVTKKFYLSRI